MALPPQYGSSSYHSPSGISSPEYGSTNYSPMWTSQQDQHQYPQQQGQYHTQVPPSTPPSMPSVFSTIPLGSNPENAALLDLVDQLRECRADRYVDLPVVVVVGDQSSGKSSVLKGLTGIPFPTSSVQCTRFATEIRLRRVPNATSVTTTVSIWAEDKMRDQARYDAFTNEFNLDDETVVFSDVFARAEAAIFQHDKTNFLSQDRLIIERTGPGLQHLTIVDLPGIIHSPTPTQTEADVDAISKLSEDYMRKDRTIIVAVVGADVQYATQIIIRRCKDADPSGKRTLGVITKPDMVRDEHVNQQFLDLANNKAERSQLFLGWHVLRNSAKNEPDSAEERDAAERAFFASSRWGREVSADNLGVDALRGKISTQHISHVAREIVNVEAEMESLLAQCRKNLTDIGYGWDSTQKMRDAFNHLCMRSRDLTNLAVRGEYDNPLRETFFPPYIKGDGLNLRRLRACVVNENLQFSDVMEIWGTEYFIGEGPLNPAPSTTKNWSTKYNVAVKPIARERFIDEYVKPLMKGGRGQEQLVDHNPKLLYSLFQTYSNNWPGVADKHIEAIQMLCNDFLDQIVKYAWPLGIQTRIWRCIVKRQLEARLRNAREVLQELKDDRFRLVQTYHSNYRVKYYELRSADTAEGEQSKHEDMLDKMLLHYEHQLPTFINNVIMQVVERKLVHGMGEIFDFVHQLKDSEVEQLMEDDSDTEAKRRVLKDELETLERGLEICGKIARRPGIGLHEYQSYRYTATTSPTPVASPPQSGQHMPFRPYTAPSQTPAAAQESPANQQTFGNQLFNHGSVSSPFVSRTRPSLAGVTKVESAQSSSTDARMPDNSRRQDQQADLHAEDLDLASSERVDFDVDVDAAYLSEREGDTEAPRERRKKKGKKKFTREFED